MFGNRLDCSSTDEFRKKGWLGRVLKASLRVACLVIAFLSLYAVSPVGVAGQQLISIETSPAFLCNLMDGRAVALGIHGADLGVSVSVGSTVWMIFGDTRGLGPGPPSGGTPTIGASSAIESQIPFSCSTFSWLVSGGKFYQPLTSARKVGFDESTVPAGAITLNGIIYIYAMQVNQWGSNSEGTHAHGVLFYREEQSSGPFAELTQWPVDQLFANAAPIASELPDGTPAVFIATTAEYRHSPVYLAYVAPSQIGDSAAYHYLMGYTQNSSPLWTTQMNDAKPLPGLENVWAGEVSFLYDGPLNSYLIMFKDYETDSFTLYSSSTPYGPFVGPLTYFPCGTPLSRPTWMESGWGLCYGGYMVPGFFGSDGNALYFVVSLWDPYTTVLMTMRLGTSSATASTSKIISPSKANTTSAYTTSTENSVAVPVLPLSIAVFGCGIALVAAAIIARKSRKPDLP